MGTVSKSGVLHWLKYSKKNQFYDLKHKVTRYQEGHAPLSPQVIVRLVYQQGQIETETLLERWIQGLSVDVYLCSLERQQSLLGIELSFDDELLPEELSQLMSVQALEVFFIEKPLSSLNEPGILVMDMDSTAIQIECIDELAKLAGVGEAVSEVTERAMAGELDFTDSLRLRVKQLKGVPASVIDELVESLPLTTGLESMCCELQHHGWKIALASGGFTPFVDSLKQNLNLSAAFANNLEIKDGLLTGDVIGEIVDAQYKANVVTSMMDEYGIIDCQSIAIGDGANDIPMIKCAYSGIAFHAKPMVKIAADHHIADLGLGVLLYLLEKKSIQ